MDNRLNDPIKRMSQSDKSALADIYAIASPKQFGAIRRLVPDTGEAAEILKTAYKEIWKRRKERSSVQSGHWNWIMAITHRCAVAHLNRSQQKRSMNNSAATPVTSLKAAMPEEEQNLLSHAYLDGAPLNDMAAQLDVDVETVQRRIVAAVNTLRKGGRS